VFNVAAGPASQSSNYSAVVGGRILANTDTFYTPTLIMLATSLVYKDSSLQRNFHLCCTWFRQPRRE